MNILLINHNAGSLYHGMAYRAYYFAREWVRSGHRVRLAAAGFSHVRGKQPQSEGRPIRRRTVEGIDGIEYVWYPAPAYSGNGIKRVVNIAAFLARLWLDARATARDFKPDVVIASSTYPMDIWVARHIARLARAKWVYEVHDLWPLSPIELGGMSPRHPFIRLCQWSEDAAYRSADLVVSMLPKVHEHMSAHGLDLRKLHVIPNGIAVDDWQGEPQPIAGELAGHLRRLRDEGHLVVGYAGSHGLPNALDYLLEAAKLLAGRPIRFVLVGDGHEKARLKKRVADEGLSNVSLFDPIPKRQIPALLQSFDIAYIGWNKTPIYRFGISPNKLMDYMMAGRVVLHSVEAGNDPVAEAGCGLTVRPESPQAIADGILALAGLSAQERSAMAARGQDYVKRHLTYPVLAEEFIRVMAAAAGPK
jgi:glycosyltransferase involved in cell wall biosynthesis